MTITELYGEPQQDYREVTKDKAVKCYNDDFTGQCLIFYNEADDGYTFKILYSSPVMFEKYRKGEN